MAKLRLDILLHKKGMAVSREKARAMILAGEVKVNGLRLDKPGSSVDEEAEIIMEPSRPRYVSRGGFKLEKAIIDFGIDFFHKIVLDVGASTGGYTDCALKNGAKKVYALDVGYGQLDWTLRNDPRVVNIERTNIRYFSAENLDEKLDIVTIDVSFISTALVFPVIKDFLKDDGAVISLIKPQFEAGREKVGKKGVVRAPEVHREVLLNCIDSANKVDLYCNATTYSPIKGPKGNMEYFILLKRQAEPGIDIEEMVASTVRKAHIFFGG